MYKQDSAAPTREWLCEVEAAPADISITVEGPRLRIDAVDRLPGSDWQGVLLLTPGFTGSAGIMATEAAACVIVDRCSQVREIAAPGLAANASAGACIRSGGFALLFYGGDSEDSGRFSSLFKQGDAVKLRLNGDIASARELAAACGEQPALMLASGALTSLSEPAFLLQGQAVRRREGRTYAVKVNGTDVPIETDGSFVCTVPLRLGGNVVEASLTEDGALLDAAPLFVFRQPASESPGTKSGDVFLWVEQGHNMLKFQSEAAVRSMLENAKAAGITAIVFDVKGVEGFAAYRRNGLTGRPYVSGMTSPDRKGANPDQDLLDLFVRHGHAAGLRVYAALNVFAEGSFYRNQFALPDRLPAWEQQLQRPEDGGRVLRQREASYARNGKATVQFVNPANDAVRDYELRGIREIVEGYDIDGILLDRCRYDNEFADFSDGTKTKFKQYLAARGKQLAHWPHDVFAYDERGTRTEGPLYADWWAFRAHVIASFVAETRSMIDLHNAQRGKAVQLAAYVGSWYELHYRYGVNWASPHFRYDRRLGLTEDALYTDEYAAAGYTGSLDFLMIGTYQQTVRDVERYIALARLVTNGELPVYAGVAIPALREPGLRQAVMSRCFGKSDGLMLFDHCHISDWNQVAEDLRQSAVPACRS
ncbi:hypothetical protein [Paenibacillus sp. MBLB4367]|uniref:hypothetical protein n=1 Tax=Paenibacillus sp. MBLB4367 TaxID=3384767 RepID=UPI0039080EB0